MARAVRALHAYQRRYAVKGIIHERFRTDKIRGEAQIDCTECDIFEAAYGDHDGSEYWESWLFENITACDVADVVATHVASSEAGAKVD